MPGMPLGVSVGCLLVIVAMGLVIVYMKRAKGTQWPSCLAGFFIGGQFVYIFAVIEPDKPEIEYFGPKVRTFFGLWSFKDAPHPEWLPPELVTILLYLLVGMCVFLTIAFLLHQWPFNKGRSRGGGGGGGNPGNFGGNPGKGGNPTGMPNMGR